MPAELCISRAYDLSNMFGKTSETYHTAHECNRSSEGLCDCCGSWSTQIVVTELSSLLRFRTFIAQLSPSDQQLPMPALSPPLPIRSSCVCGRKPGVSHESHHSPLRVGDIGLPSAPTSPDPHLLPASVDVPLKMTSAVHRRMNKDGER